MGDGLDERLVELEMRSAYQERTVAELNEVILELRGRLDVLVREMEALREQATKGGFDVGPANDRPPHW